MKKIKSTKKGAELPLNTIVIALLVIIVLVVIIAFFISKMGETGSQLGQTGSGVTDCSLGNYAISEDDYSSASYEKWDSDNNKCKEEWVRIYTVPKDDQDRYCCALPKTVSSE